MDGMTDLEILRVVLARELETINAYSALARQATDPSVQRLLQHISEDGEEHVAECIQWISRLNPVLATFLSRTPDHVADKPLKSETLASARPPAEPPVIPPASSPQLTALLGGGQMLSPSGLTVGSLLGRVQNHDPRE